MQNSHIENESPERYPDVTGVLLAGGKSRRMGRDKAQLRVNGRRLFETSLELLRRYFATVFIAGDRPDLAGPELPTVPDIYPGSALGGLHTGLKTARTDWVFVAPCDMPFPDGRIVENLLAQRDGYDAVVPRTPKGLEPVFALYHKNCLWAMEQTLVRGEFRIYDFYRQIRVMYVDSQELPPGWERALVNINHPDDLRHLTEEAS